MSSQHARKQIWLKVCWVIGITSSHKHCMTGNHFYDLLNHDQDQIWIVQSSAANQEVHNYIE